MLLSSSLLLIILILLVLLVQTKRSEKVVEGRGGHDRSGNWTRFKGSAGLGRGRPKVPRSGTAGCANTRRPFETHDVQHLKKRP